MLRFAVLGGVGLLAAGCIDDEAQSATSSPGDHRGWHFASGKPPSRAEYVAFVAACQDGTMRRAQGKPLDSCLADLGLRRAP